MADTYSKIVEILDNTQYIAALKKAEEEEKILADLRTLGGKAAVKAYQDTERAAKRAAAETERLNAKMAAGPSKFDQLLASVKANDDELKNLHKSANQAGEGIGRIAAAASLVSPQLGAMIAGLQKIEGTIGGVLSLQESLFGVEAAAKAATAATEAEAAAALDAAAASGDMSAAIGAGVEAGGVAVLILSELAAGYLDYESGVRAATAAEKDRIDIAQQGIDLDKMILKAQRAAIEQMGGDAAAKAKEADIDQQWNDVADKLNKTLQDRLDVVQQQIAQGGLASSAAQALIEDEKNLTAAIAENTAKAKLGADADKVGAEYAQEKAEADRTAAKDAKAAADAKTAAAKAQAEANKAEQEANAVAALRLRLLLQEAGAESKREQDFDKARDALDQIHDATVRASASTEDKIRLDAQAAREAAVSAANEAQAKTSADQEGASDRKRIALELRETLDLINQGEVVDLRKAEEAKTKTAREEAKKRSDTALNYAEDLTGNVSDLLADAADKVGETNEDAGRRLWAASKTIGVLQSTIAAYKAAAETTAAVAAIPGGQPFAIPAGLAMFAAVEGATVAKIAATPPPTFDDTPLGGWKPSQNARSATFAADDTVIAARNPQELIRQAVAATVDRQMARPARRTTSEQPRSATTPTARLLTSDLSKTVRGRR